MNMDYENEIELLNDEIERINNNVDDNNDIPPSSDIIKQNTKVMDIMDDEKLTKESYKRKRKTCTVCDELIFVDEFYNPELHECQKYIRKVKDDMEPTEPMEPMEPTEPTGPKYKKEVAAEHMYNMQLAAYFALESATSTMEINELNGLSHKMVEMKEQYKLAFESIYEEYGDNMDTVISPIALWAMITAQNFGSTILENKKKNTSAEE